MSRIKSITDLITEFFQNHPNQEMKHGPVVDWVEENYYKLYKRKPRDTWRAIRKLYQDGFLIKVKKGVYKHEPNLVTSNKLEDFSIEQKRQIIMRDGFKCVQCGRRQDEGYELHVDHRIPKDRGGTASLDNGQTLCSICNFRKKNYGQTESGKKMLIRLWEASIKIKDEKTKKFCEEVLMVYEKYDINGHIEWKKK